MDPGVKASLLWGLVGGLAFLVLVQAYDALTRAAVGATVKVGVTVAVAAVAALATHVLRPRVLARLDGS